MNLRNLSVPVVCGLALLSACAKDGALPPTGPRVAIDVAPLTLPNVLGVEYALAVFNANPTPYSGIFDSAGAVQAPLANLVWQQPSVTSNQYGNGPGGGVAYVGPCDASEAENWVALALRQIDVGANNGSYGGAAPFSGTANVLDDENSAFSNSPGSNDGDPDFENPCDFGAPCVMKFRCAENEDTEVVFNLTIMRDAEQGFFDIAVDFEDVFCSMKVDTCYGEDDPIELLFDDVGNRVETAVIAAACSAGVGEGETVMWMGPVTVSCAGGVSFTIDPTGDDDVDPATPGRPGNHSTDASYGGTETDPGAKATGTLTFSVASLPGGVTLTIASGTPVSRSDTGLDYLTTAAATLSAGTLTAGVATIAADEGDEYDGATTFASISLPGSDGNIYVLTVTGAGFSGGVDPTVVGAIQAEIGYALYWGQEALDCGGPQSTASCNKAYWNLAINLGDLADAGFEDCNVTTAITASAAPALDQFDNGTLTGPGETYGFVQIDAPLLEGSDPTCFQGPMGSEYAATRYGASPDMIGATPFPNLCYFFERGTEAPQSLGDIDGYFRDVDGSPDQATYAGRIPTDAAAAPLALTFADMGGDNTGLCRARVTNTTTAIWFDGAASLQEFSWRGSGGTGVYRIQIFTRGGSSAPWQLWGGYEIDLRTDDGRAFFAAGSDFENAGDDQVAIVLTRIDTPIAIVDDVVLSVGPATP